MVTTAADPKVAALVATRSLNPHPEKVTDTAFLASRFCDARDVVQVKYEMVRRVRVDGLPVTQAARAFGYCRQAFYEVAAALDAGGPGALAAGKPGPKGPLKLTDPVMDQVEGWLAADPDLRSATWPTACRTCSGSPSIPARWSVPWPAAARPATPRSPKPGPDPGPEAGVEHYERLREAAGSPQHGLAVLAAKGLVAFLRVTTALVPAAQRQLPSSTAPRSPAGPVDPEIIRVWSRMVLAHAPLTCMNHRLE